MTRTPGRVVDAGALKGLAHPLRLALLSALETRGRATASQLAADLGESSGATSYHLRQLHRHGFIQEADQGNGRERWREPVAGGWELPADSLRSSPVTRAATDLVLNNRLDASTRRLQSFIGSLHEWSPAWQNAVQRLEWHCELDPDQLTELNREIVDVLARYKAMTPGPGARRVLVEQSAFPLGAPEGA